MGATTFVNVIEGISAKSAFQAITSDARYENGHGGYTGSIAEKLAFVHIAVVTSEGAVKELVYKLLDEGDERIDDKWGPAGCITIKRDGAANLYVFFGWASE